MKSNGTCLAESAGFASTPCCFSRKRPRTRRSDRVRVLDILRPPLVAIDVGTATTRIHWRSATIEEAPSVVREDLHGRVVARPVMRDGVVADIGGMANVIAALLDRRCRTWRRRPAAVVCAPTDVSTQERDALIEAVAAG